MGWRNWRSIKETWNDRSLVNIFISIHFLFYFILIIPNFLPGGLPYGFNLFYNLTYSSATPLNRTERFYSRNDISSVQCAVSFNEKKNLLFCFVLTEKIIDRA